MRQATLSLLLIFILASCNGRKLHRDPVSHQMFDSLLEYPENYNQKEVELYGYYVDEFENVCIYRTKSVFLSGKKKNAVWINLQDGFDIESVDFYDYDKKYVRVVGIYDTKWKGHLNQYHGELNINSIELLD